MKKYFIVLPLVPAILLFVAVIGFVALAYYLGGKKICNMNLAETIKDDTLMWCNFPIERRIAP